MGRSAKAAKQNKRVAKEKCSSELTESVSTLSLDDNSTDVICESTEVCDNGVAQHVARTCTGVLSSLPTAKDIKIINFCMQLFGKKLIENTTIEFTIGRRYGLLGSNGCGKSTFMKALAAREIPIPDHIDIFLLNEEYPKTELTAVEAVVEQAKNEILRLENQVEHIMETEGSESPLTEELYERIDALDPETFETRASKILHGLGFDQVMIKKKTKDMSGGWRMRVSLARALFVKPTLLLLDEPTNHLDLEACVWLENYLKDYDRILVLISHSQDFLNAVCTHIMHMHKGKLVYYTGNYDQYVKTREENEVNQMKLYNKQQEEIAHIKKFIASCGTYSNLVRQAKSRQKILDKMVADGLIEKVERERNFTFRFTDVDKLPPPVLSFYNVAFAYSGRMQDALYSGLELAIDTDSRIALVGPNGAGKSTLLKLMTGKLNPIEGRIERHQGLKMAVYNQHTQELLPFDKTALEFMRDKYPQYNYDFTTWRTQLGRYGVSGEVQTSLMGNLSDGQRSRIVFAVLAFEKPNLLLLDEPTNHLDMECIDSLSCCLTSCR